MLFFVHKVSVWRSFFSTYSSSARKTNKGSRSNPPTPPFPPSLPSSADPPGGEAAVKEPGGPVDGGPCPAAAAAAAAPLAVKQRDSRHSLPQLLTSAGSLGCARRSGHSAEKNAALRTAKGRNQPLQRLQQQKQQKGERFGDSPLPRVRPLCPLGQCSSVCRDRKRLVTVSCSVLEKRNAQNLTSDCAERKIRLGRAAAAAARSGAERSGGPLTSARSCQVRSRTGAFIW